MSKNNIMYAVMIFVLMAVGACSNSKSIQTLFDGNSIDQWTAQGDVKLNDSILSLENDASLTLTDGSFDNFELKLTARTVDTGKGFIAFHTDDHGNGGYRVAFDNDTSAMQWWTKTGSLLSVRNLVKSLVKTGEWFDMSIRVDGKTITVRLNEYPVVEYTEPDKPFRTADHADQLLSKGTIFIKNTGGGNLEFKRIAIEKIKPASPAIVSSIDESADDIVKLHQENFPVLDYHVHLKGGWTGEQAAEQSRKFGINYALAPNCGIGFPIQNDAQVIHYLDSMKGQPFVFAMQGEGREWPTTFSKEVRDRFDYVFTDAMTFIDTKGNRTRLWIPEEVFIDDEQKYMDLIVDKIVEVMEEPMDVYVNPTFLPDVMSDRYDEFWTEERMNRVIDAMVQNGKALEINNRYKIPHKTFIRKAKAAGLKFTFGTNNTDANLGKLEYCIEMKNECGITADDMYKPHIKP